MAPITIKLALYSSPDRTASFHVASPEEDGLDLGRIGRLFGVDPTTVRLNGHFLSRGPHHVSSLTWASLLSFFSARGFPAGTSDLQPIVVHGKPAAYIDLEDEDHPIHLSFKRKIKLEDENPCKKNRISINNPEMRKVADGAVSDDVIVCIRKRLKLNDNQPSKKPKTSHCNPGLDSEASNLSTVSSRFGFTYNCNSELGKRFREDEMIVPISCKRIK